MNKMKKPVGYSREDAIDERIALIEHCVDPFKLRFKIAREWLSQKSGWNQEKVLPRN